MFFIIPTFIKMLFTVIKKLFNVYPQYYKLINLFSKKSKSFIFTILLYLFYYNSSDSSKNKQSLYKMNKLFNIPMRLSMNSIWASNPLYAFRSFKRIIFVKTYFRNNDCIWKLYQFKWKRILRIKLPIKIIEVAR